MFTGLVATTGELTRREPRGPGARLGVRASFPDGPLALGESNLGALAVGDRVNVEVDLIARYVARWMGRDGE